MATDREYLKAQQAGALNTTGASTPRSEVNQAHSRTFHIQKTGTENAATNVAETFAIVVPRKSHVNSVKYLTGTNTAADTTDYALISLYKGTSATVVATYNTHTSAQGAITEKVAAAFSLSSTDSALTLDAGSVLSFGIGKYGNGKAIAAGVIAVDLEEI